MWDLIASVPDHCLSFYFTFFQSFLPLKILGWSSGFRAIDDLPLAN